MADVCEQWEAAFRAAITPATRRVVLRFGVVLGRDGGALPMLAQPRPLGTRRNGRQRASVHQLDPSR